ncbi:MAG: hypothetical protein HS108_05410 [Planctomycetes bacterium]|jgi:hypothetical protein|nr:hypothetical protein [Planctomycetota bacterium]MCL4730722.1 hypothetical protein [Planctomycetota bacterium]
MTWRLWVVPVLLLALGAGCAATTRWDAEYERAPQAVRADWDLARRRCSRCHSLERVFLQLELDNDRDDVRWTVEDMARRPSSGIAPQEVEPITGALDWYRTRQNPR